MTTNGRTRLGRITAAGVALATGATLALAIPASAAGGGHHPARHHHHSHGGGYLALGDSVSFGYREAANQPPPNYPDATSFVGFPEDVAAELHLRTVNASCPGETSGSLIDESAPSNGCESSADGTGPGYRDLFPLHVDYPGSQLDFAVHYLRRHHHTRVVTLMIGANDGFLCQRTTPDQCASELPDVLHQVAANVSTILDRLRRAGHYRGQIVIVDYYSLDYSDPAQNAQSQALNQAMDSGAAGFHVSIADGFAAFQNAAAQAGGDSCAAGLLTTLSTGGCGVHPSVAGQELLAGAVERVIR